jgi:hypothetical protein
VAGFFPFRTRRGSRSSDARERIEHRVTDEVATSCDDYTTTRAHRLAHIVAAIARTRIALARVARDGTSTSRLRHAYNTHAIWIGYAWGVCEESDAEAGRNLAPGHARPVRAAGHSYI